MSGPLSDEIRFDPDDLDGFYGAVSAASGRDRTLSLSRVEVGSSALDELPAAVSRSREMRRVVLFADSTPMVRGVDDLKALVARQLGALGRPVEQVTIPGDSHATADRVHELAGQLRDGDVVVSVGSGTVTDIAKHAIHTATPVGVRHIAVATANSVGAYTSELAVVTTQGVKRTMPSRLPDELILDTQVLASTPHDIALGGIGDAAVGWGSLADYRLAALCGLGHWEPLAARIFLPGLRGFLRSEEAFTAGGTDTAEAMALTLCAAGFVMSFAGESAPASGLEHVTSHVLDMTAAREGRSIGNHGEQCGLATALSLLAYDHLLNEVDANDLQPVAPDPARVHAEVAEAFGPLGEQVVAECWSDVAVKVTGWSENLEHIRLLVENWQHTREQLQELLADPLEYLRALHATGHPLHFEQIEPGIPQEQARFAFANARLMRKRLSVADFLAFNGLWTPELIDTLFERFRKLRDQVLSAG
ncbi:iron-containing alcohol dehydrogenase [Propionibacteriaceae bacterium Y1923]|uniref:iron-containing alcohol dehydrogenase n=1 Tax=Aestuariimicrobium sp. Y1814 TaxID=3418742 RepID=UPI003C1BF10B